MSLANAASKSRLDWAHHVILHLLDAACTCVQGRQQTRPCAAARYAEQFQRSDAQGCLELAGKLLSQSVRDIYDDFTAAMEAWQHVDYTIIDVAAAPRFDPDYRAFRASIASLERRLCQARRCHFVCVCSAECGVAAVHNRFRLVRAAENVLQTRALGGAPTFLSSTLHVCTLGAWIGLCLLTACL